MFISCSSDASIRIWDVRAPPPRACQVTVASAHDGDVNVITWSRRDPAALLSGGDDGILRLWDLRNIQVRPQTDPNPLQRPQIYPIDSPSHLTNNPQTTPETLKPPQRPPNCPKDPQTAP